MKSIVRHLGRISGRCLKAGALKRERGSDWKYSGNTHNLVDHRGGACALGFAETGTWRIASHGPINRHG